MPGQNVQQLLKQAEAAYRELELVMEKFRIQAAIARKKLSELIDQKKIAKVRQSLNKQR